MTSSSVPPSKGDQTRQYIYQTATKCFRERAYDTVSMREIAAAADVSVGLIYHYFASKEDIALRWYDEQVKALATDMAGLAAGQLADRYHQALVTAIRGLRPMRGAMIGLFSGAMRSDADVSLMENPQSQLLSNAYRQLVLESDDALREPKATELGIVLYTFSHVADSLLALRPLTRPGVDGETSGLCARDIQVVASDVFLADGTAGDRQIGADSHAGSAASGELSRRHCAGRPAG